MIFQITKAMCDEIDEMSKIHCKTCEFFVSGHIMGACKRYPEIQNKHEMDWCGEHKLLQHKNISVYEIMQEKTEMSEIKPKIDIKFDEPEQRKKPGRKPKISYSSAS